MRIFTDPHLGRKAGAHTTKKSSELLDEAICDNALDASLSEDTTVCAGDLFDKSHNHEIDILKGLTVAKQCDLVVSGNHDESNRENTRTSIELVGEVTKNLVRVDTSCVLVESYDDDNFSFSVIPHHSSQDLFDQAINQACEGEKEDLLFLHCNFNNPFAQNDASLNLSTEQAELLLQRFKYIVLGHEHNHRWEMDGRLLILGNTHPTNFGDIGDKYYWDYSPKSGFIKTKIWDKSTQYAKLPVLALIEEGFNFEGQNFIEVYGEEIDPELAPKVAQAMQDVWASGDERLFMVRNNVKFKQLVATTVDSDVQLEDVTKAITKDLKNSDMLELWQKHLGEAQNA